MRAPAGSRDKRDHSKAAAFRAEHQDHPSSRHQRRCTHIGSTDNWGSPKFLRSRTHPARHQTRRLPRQRRGSRRPLPRSCRFRGLPSRHCRRQVLVAARIDQREQLRRIRKPVWLWGSRFRLTTSTQIMLLINIGCVPAVRMYEPRVIRPKDSETNWERTIDLRNQECPSGNRG